VAEKHNPQEPMAGALRRALRKGDQAAGPHCADAEILAAYYERSLDSRETAHWEAHFSHCAHCRSTLAALAAAEPADTFAPLSAGVKSPLPERVRTGAAWIWNWRWLAPVGAAAAALAVWVALRPVPLQMPPPADTSEQQVAREAARRGGEFAAPSATVPAPSQPAPRAEKEVRAASDSKAMKAPGATTDTVALSRRRALEEGRAVARSEADKETQQLFGKPVAAPQAVRSEAAENRAARDAAAPAPERAGEKKQQVVVAQAEAPPKAESTVRVAEGALVLTTPAAPAETRATGLTEMRLRAAQPAALSALERQPAEFIVATPDRKALWRVKPGGSIELSRDNGKTWQVQENPVKMDLAAGSAPSEKVCWLAGAAGTVLRTADGAKWEKTTTPVEADLIAIEARDALQATVTAADGRKFTTRDGGRTWTAEN
jgi:hypothetical protein